MGTSFDLYFEGDVIAGSFIKYSDIPALDETEQLRLMKSWFIEHYDLSISTKENCEYDKDRIIDPYTKLMNKFCRYIDPDLIARLTVELIDVSQIWVEPLDESDYSIDTSTSPFDLFNESIDRLYELLSAQKGYKSPEVEQHFYGLIHSSAFTSLETYLLSTFTKVVFSTDEVLKDFITKQTKYTPPKYDVADLLTGSEHIQECVDKVKKDFRRSLINLSWHNPQEVLNRFAMLGIKVEVDIDKLKNIANIRHDIVHRNGVDMDGVSIHISPDDLDDTLGVIGNLVERIEWAVNDPFY